MKIINLNEAVEVLKAGGLIVLPTDTVYGIACDMANEGAVKKVYEIKGRSQEKPLIILVHSKEIVKDYVSGFSDMHKILMDKFWPGALSLIFKISDKIPKGVNSGGEKIGIRMPNQPDILKVIDALGRPIVATSVNKSGNPALLTIEDIAREFPELPIVDGGNSVLGTESTIVDIDEYGKLNVLREGAIKRAELEDLINNFGIKKAE